MPKTKQNPNEATNQPNKKPQQIQKPNTKPNKQKY